MQDKPFWKTNQGMVLIAGGGVILLGTLWLFASTMRPAPATITAAPPTSNIVDENALIAANAERPGETAAAAAGGNEAKPAEPAPTATQASADKPSDRFSPDDIAAEAQRALDDAQDQIDEAKPEQGSDDFSN